MRSTQYVKARPTTSAHHHLAFARRWLARMRRSSCRRARARRRKWHSSGTLPHCPRPSCEGVNPYKRHYGVNQHAARTDWYKAPQKSVPAIWWAGLYITTVRAFTVSLFCLSYDYATVKKYDEGDMEGQTRVPFTPPLLKKVLTQTTDRLAPAAAASRSGCGRPVSVHHAPSPQVRQLRCRPRCFRCHRRPSRCRCSGGRPRPRPVTAALPRGTARR